MRHHSTTSGLAPPPLPSKQYLMDRLGNLEIDPKGFFRNAANGSSNRGAAHLANEPRDESVEAKWEHLQYYEARLQDSSQEKVDYNLERLHFFNKSNRKN
jgi:hypothetical protein